MMAHELYGDVWLNAEPVPVSALQGRVLLLQFWDYSSMASIRTLPYMREWHARYEPYGLVVVGVHSPRFPFGRDPERVASAVRRFGISYPVVLDNQQAIAASYDNRQCPTMMLVDKHGFVRYQSTGEGNYDATEHMIQSLLRDAGVRDDLPLPMEPVREEDRPGAMCYRSTPELFAGYLRGSIGNNEGSSPESITEYADPGYYIDGKFYAVGRWRSERNSLRLFNTDPESGQVVLPYQAVEVGAILVPETERGFAVRVTQDGDVIPEDQRGEDVIADEEERSVVIVDEPRLYQLVRNKEFGAHTLRLEAKNASFAFYGFSFVSGAIPETVSNN
jgi:hypothetical protein